MILLRNSERSSFTRCRWAWDLAYNKRVKPRHESPALRFGSLVHLALEDFYCLGRERGPLPAETFSELYQRDLDDAYSLGWRDEDGVWADAHEVGVDMLEHYVEHYGVDERWEVLATELSFQTPILHPRTGRKWFRAVGTIDLVVRDVETGFVGLVDHKTTKDDPTRSSGYLTMDDQAGTYWKYGRQALRELGLLPQDAELNGLIFNFLRKAVRDKRPKNLAGLYLNSPTVEALRAAHEAQVGPADKKQGGPGASKAALWEALERHGVDPAMYGEVSKTQPSPYFHRETIWRNEDDAESFHERVLQQYREIYMVRAGKLAVYKSPSKMNCSFCSFRDVCELHESGSDYQGLLDATTEPWDPYASHEEGK